MARRIAPTVVALEITRRHHLDGWSRSDLARHYALSRFQVARILETARRERWVRIEVDEPSGIDASRGDRVRDALGLRHVVVARSGPSGAVTRRELAVAAAALVDGLLARDDVLGLAWSRTVAEAVDHLGAVPRVPVVQLSGSLARPDEVDSNDLVRRFASASGGPAYVYDAPTVLPEERDHSAVRRRPEVAGAFDRLGEVTVALVAAGGWGPGQSTLYDALGPVDRADGERRGVAGEVCSLQVDARGEPVATLVAPRLLRPTATELAAVPHVVAVVPGEHRGDLVRAVAASGLVHSLVLAPSTADNLTAG